MLKESGLYDFVGVQKDRYDELLRKETLLDAIARMHGKTADYLFREMVGHLLNIDAPMAAEKTDE